MKQRRILIVDDDKDFVESMGEIIELEGHQPILAYNGLEAIKLFKQSNIDIIIVDFKMPGLNGIETLMEIRKLHATVPIVMMTAYSDTKFINDAKKQGAIAILDKPFNINKLTKIISSIKTLRNILILDDDKDFADSLSIALVDEGYRVSLAHNTDQALNYISDNDIHLQILDIRIDEKSDSNEKTGIDVWISTRKNRLEIPTIFISGYIDDFFNQIEEILEISQIEILKKPITPVELLNKIRDLNIA